MHDRSVARNRQQLAQRRRNSSSSGADWDALEDDASADDREDNDAADGGAWRNRRRRLGGRDDGAGGGEVDAAVSASGSGMAVACAALRAAMHATPDGLGTNDTLREVFHNVLGVRFMQLLVAEFLCSVWNECASARVKRFGSRVILEGDLVLPKPFVSTAAAASAASSCSLPMSSYPDDTCSSPRSNARNRQQPIPVTQDDITRGRYTYRDVLLPLPGYGVVLPSHLGLRTMLRDILHKSHGLEMNPETLTWDVFAGGGDGEGVDEMEATTGEEDGAAGSSRWVAAADLHLRQLTPVPPPAAPPTSSGSDAASDVVMSSRHSNAPPPQRRLEVSSLAALPSTSVSSTIMSQAVSPSAALDGGLPMRRRRWGNGLGVPIYGAYRRLYGDGSTLTVSDMPSMAATSSSASSSPSNNATTSSSNMSGMPSSMDRGAKSFTAGGPSMHARSLVSVELRFSLPSSMYSAMLLRELTKYDVNSGAVMPKVQCSSEDPSPTRTSDGGAGGANEERKATSWDTLSPGDKQLYRQMLAKRKKVRASPPEAMALAQLHKQVFSSGGMRKSLLPSTRGYNDVAK